MGRHAVFTEARFISKLREDANESGCTLWLGARNLSGRGRLAISTAEGGGIVDVHRYAYERAKGPIPKGMDVVHVCGVLSCVRLDHLDLMSHREALLQAPTLATDNRKKTHCPRGHEYNEENTFLYRGRRYCRACRNKTKVQPTLEEIRKMMQAEKVPSNPKSPRKRTHCKYGHKYTQENLVAGYKKRVCKTCFLQKFKVGVEGG